MDPRIAATTDNRFVLAWSRSINEGSGSLNDIYYAIRDSAGGEVVPVTALTTDTPGAYEAYAYPAVAALGGARALLAWTRESDDDIYYSVRDSAGNVVQAVTNLSSGVGSSWEPDAVELSNGHSLVAWSSNQGGVYRITYALLDAGYNRIASPTVLSNAAAATGDGYVSVAADDAGHGILTWLDYDSSSDYYTPHLYYALVGPSGDLLTEPLIFFRSQATVPQVETSHEGYGNTSYSWRPSAEVDGAVAFGDPLAGAPPGGHAQLGVEVANYGGATATGIQLVATLDAALTYVGDDSGCTPVVSGDNVTWNLPDLGYLNGLTFHLTVQVPAAAAYGTRYPVTLNFSSDGPEVDPSNNTAAAEVMIARRIFLPLVLGAH